MRYAVVVERTRRNVAAYVPDLPGCIATAPSVAELRVAIRQAVELHIAGMRADGIAVPLPSRASQITRNCINRHSRERGNDGMRANTERARMKY